MDWWMYAFIVGMFLIAIVGTIWITLWTIQRGERARSGEARRGQSPERPIGTGREEARDAGS